MPLMTLKRSARTFPIAALPWTRRPHGSGPRAIRKVASSAKKLRIRSTSRLLKAALISISRSMLGPVAVEVVVMGPTLPAPGPPVKWGGIIRACHCPPPARSRLVTC